jgi:hypothetical protein
MARPAIHGRISNSAGEVQLEPRAMDLLVLAERAGEPVSPRELVDRVWRTESVPGRTVGHRIAELRDALGDGGGNPGYIETVPDLTKPPLHTLPRAELVARLKALTNLRVVRDTDDPENYVVRAEPSPGWRTVPEW